MFSNITVHVNPAKTNIPKVWIFNFLFIRDSLRLLLLAIIRSEDWSLLMPLASRLSSFSALTRAHAVQLLAILFVTYCLHRVGNTFRNLTLLPGRRPERRITGKLGHITIQCPVYKESLAGVIDPTIQSLKIAVAAYISQGGTASIFMNDDGMQLLDPETRAHRLEYYGNHDIGWVARPPHQEDGYVRVGRFRKVISWMKLLK